jgi:hypothetical protein
MGGIMDTLWFILPSAIKKKILGSISTSQPAIGKAPVGVHPVGILPPNFDIANMLTSTNTVQIYNNPLYRNNPFVDKNNAMKNLLEQPLYWQEYLPEDDGKLIRTLDYTENYSSSNNGKVPRFRKQLVTIPYNTFMGYDFYSYGASASYSSASKTYNVKKPTLISPVNPNVKVHKSAIETLLLKMADAVSYRGWSYVDILSGDNFLNPVEGSGTRGNRTGTFTVPAMQIEQDKYEIRQVPILPPVFVLKQSHRLTSTIGSGKDYISSEWSGNDISPPHSAQGDRVKYESYVSGKETVTIGGPGNTVQDTNENFKFNYAVKVNDTSDLLYIKYRDLVFPVASQTNTIVSNSDIEVFIDKIFKGKKENSKSTVASNLQKPYVGQLAPPTLNIIYTIAGTENSTSDFLSGNQNIYNISTNSTYLTTAEQTISIAAERDIKKNEHVKGKNDLNIAVQLINDVIGGIVCRDCLEICVNACKESCSGSCGYNGCKTSCLDVCKTGCKDGCHTDCMYGCTKDCIFGCASTSCYNVCKITCIADSPGCSCMNSCRKDCDGHRFKCAGWCYGGCHNRCGGGVYGDCNNMDCSLSCRIMCYDRCSINSCSSTCVFECRGNTKNSADCTLCSIKCNGTCVADWGGTCNATCSGSGNSCSSDCSHGCYSTCNNGCNSGCKGCIGCGTNCSYQQY